MAFFQTDLDPIYLREQHRDTTYLVKTNPAMTTTTTTTHSQAQEQLSKLPTTLTTTKLFQHFFKGSIKEKQPSVTSDPMNRFISFHL